MARWRLGMAGGAVLASTLATVGTTPAVRADDGCPAGLDWSGPSNNGFFDEEWATQYVATSVKPDFLVSESRAVENGTGTPIQASFTSTVSKTFTLTFTVGFSSSFFGFLTGSVSASITQSTTTTTGVSATAPVPAFGRVVGEYGVEAYDVSYTQNIWHNIGDNPPGLLCSLDSATQGTSVAPTTFTGWRVVPG